MTTTRQLEIFVKIAEVGSVRLAAEQLEVSQPTVSKHLKALESHLGAALFERRRGRRLVLSKLGERILIDARQSMAAGQRIRSKLSSATRVRQPTIFVRSFMNDWVKANFDALQESGLPPSTTFVLVDDTEDIEARVHAKAGSMGLYRSAGRLKREGLRISVLKTETESLYCAPAMAAALAKGSLAAKDVQYFHQVRNAEIDLPGMKLLESAGLEQARWVDAPQFIEVVAQKVAQGEGVALFLDWHAREMVDAGKLVRLSADSAAVYLRLIGHQAVEPALFGKAENAFMHHV